MDPSSTDGILTSRRTVLGATGAGLISLAGVPGSVSAQSSGSPTVEFSFDPSQITPDQTDPVTIETTISADEEIIRSVEGVNTDLENLQLVDDGSPGDTNADTYSPPDLIVWEAGELGKTDEVTVEWEAEVPTDVSVGADLEFTVTVAIQDQGTIDRTGTVSTAAVDITDTIQFTPSPLVEGESVEITASLDANQEAIRSIERVTTGLDSLTLESDGADGDANVDEELIVWDESVGVQESVTVRWSAGVPSGSAGSTFDFEIEVNVEGQEDNLVFKGQADVTKADDVVEYYEESDSDSDSGTEDIKITEAVIDYRNDAGAFSPEVDLDKTITDVVIEYRM